MTTPYLGLFYWKIGYLWLGSPMGIWNLNVRDSSQGVFKKSDGFRLIPLWQRRP